MTTKNLTPPHARLLALLLSALAALAAGCGEPSPQTQPQTNAPAELQRERVVGTPGGTLTYRVMAPVKTLNPLMFTDESSFIIAVQLLNSRLIDFDHDAQKYAPGLAESWQLGEDGRTLELTLRDGLKFSDGQPLTTEDVAFTLRAMYDERVGSIFRPTMTIGERQIEAQITDPRRMRLVFPEVVAAPETYLINMFVLPRHVLESELKKSAEAATPGANTNANQTPKPNPPPSSSSGGAGTSALSGAYGITSDPQSIVTAGPFVVESAVPGERVTLKRNPHYWKKDAAGNQLPYLEKLVVEVIPDANAAVTRLNEGGLDILDRLRATDYAALRAGQGAARAYDLGPGLLIDHIVFNLNPGGQGGKPYVVPAKRAWFEDLRFRRAVSHAIDRQTLATTTLQGLATPLYGFVSPGNRAWAAQDVPRTEYDLEKARALLREAGFETRGTGEAPELFDRQGNRVEFTMIVSATSEERKAAAAVVQEDLARLGIRMQVAPVATSEVVARTLQSFDYEASLFGIVASDPDPSSYSNLLKSSSENHQWYPKQPKPATQWEARMDELVGQLSRETNQERRRAVFREMQLLFAENLPVVPIVARHMASAANTRVGNFRPSPIVPYSMWNAEELFVRK
ncbi:MAG TPA: ABC transporter substrate-binding protein [Pyrinomonadaceae bacterium]|nr:ABC transporter substrate-binding protein [Pyrinomonadaceae bacterium]